jgi:hypothetical protein
MPAPKQLKPGPRTISEVVPVSRGVVTKGRYAVVAPEAPIVDDPAVVEIVVDDVTIVMEPTSKYEQRSLHGYGEVVNGDEAFEDIEDVEEVVPEPVLSEVAVFGEWRSESRLEGTRYHRKDSRRI